MHGVRQALTSPILMHCQVPACRACQAEPRTLCQLLHRLSSSTPQLTVCCLHAVRFAMDRAGLVGADGATHCGFADIAYMGCLPNMVLMAVRSLALSESLSDCRSAHLQDAHQASTCCTCSLCSPARQDYSETGC